MGTEDFREGADDASLETVEIERRPHEEHYVHYTHEMTEDTKDGAGRFVVRAVPLLYGFLVGGLTDNLAAGLMIGGAVSVGSDLAMDKGSLFRPLFRPVASAGCPALALIATGIASVIEAVGLTAPQVLRKVRCGAS